MKRIIGKMRHVWGVVEAPVLLVGSSTALLIWAYSNFATAAQMQEVKADLRAYVDQKHMEVAGTLDDIKQELGKQRSLQEQILLRVRNR